MNYKLFGRKTGLRVSELALGAGNFGSRRFGYGTSPQEARIIFDRYAESGGNFIDTADSYQAGESEELLSEFIASERDHFVLGTKYSMAGKEMLTAGNSRKTMIQALEKSLKRLRTDRIDLYWVHMADGQTPMEEILRGLDDQVRAGKILYIGFSNFPAWRISYASLLADLRGWTPVAGIEIEYNLIERTPDRELLPMAEALGLGVAYWSPLAGGTLTGKYRSDIKDPNTRKEKWFGHLVRNEATERETAILDALDRIAAQTGTRMGDVALAWLRQKDDHTTVNSVTILGPRTPDQFEANIASQKLTLDVAQLRELDSVSAVQPGYPHEIISKFHPAMFASGSGRVKQHFPVV